MDGLDRLYGLAATYLRGFKECEDYLGTVTGERNNNPASLTFAQSDCTSVVAHMAPVAETACDASHELVEALLHHRDVLDWFQVYKTGDAVGKGKMDRTAVSLLAGPGAAFEPKHGRMGFYFLRDGVEYAPHAHAPREIYAVLSGTARYWTPDDGWVTRGAGDVIHQPSWQWHAMTTCIEPVLILWAWIGDDLDTAPVLREGDKGALSPGWRDI